MCDERHALWRELAVEFQGYSHRFRMSQEQLELVSELRAPIAYAALRSNVTLHPADDLGLLEAQATSLEAVRVSGVAGITAYAASETRRELHVKRKVGRFLQSHPGEELAIVYGAMHYFVSM